MSQKGSLDSLSSNLELVARHLANLFRHQWLILVLIIAAVLWNLVLVALQTPLGTDELMARVSAQEPGLYHMLQLLRDQPVNVDAPVFPILAYLAARLPLPIDFAIRIPAMIAMCISICAVFALMLDQLGLGAAYIAALLLASNSYTLYGAKARPYSFLLAGVALTLLCWQRAVEGGRNHRFWLIALSFSVGFALLSHYFAAFYILAMAVGEAVRCLRKRKIDWPIWTAAGIGVLVFIPVYLTFTPAAQPYRAHPFDRLSASDLSQTYRDTANLHLIAFTLIATICLRAVFGKRGNYRALPAYIWVTAVFLVLGPVLLYAEGMVYTHTYATRYGICGLLGVVVIMSAVLHKIAGGSTRVLLPACVFAFIFNQVHWIGTARDPVYSPASQWHNASAEFLGQNGDLPVVTPDFDFWMRTKFYAPAWLSSKLTMVSNPGSMLTIQGTENPALAAMAIHRWTGWPLVDYYAFVRDHRQFLMYGEYWMGDALKADGAHVEFLNYLGPYRLYRVVLPPISR